MTVETPELAVLMTHDELRKGLLKSAEELKASLEKETPTVRRKRLSTLIVLIDIEHPGTVEIFIDQTDSEMEWYIWHFYRFRWIRVRHLGKENLDTVIAFLGSDKWLRFVDAIDFENYRSQEVLEEERRKLNIALA